MDKLEKYRGKIAVRQTILLVLFVLLIGLMIFYMEYNINESMEQEQLITLETVSAKITAGMTDYFERQWSHLNYVEESMKLKNYRTKDEIFQMLRRVRKAHGLDGTSSLLILVDEKGYYYTSDAGRVALWRGVNSSAGLLPDYRALTLNSLAEMRNHLEQYICFIQKMEQPITAADGTAFPYVVLAADEQVFEIDLSMGEFGTVTDAFVMSSNGRKVSAQMGRLDIAKSYNILSALRDAKFLLGDDYRQMLRQIKNGQSGSSLVNYRGEDYFLSHHYMGIEDWNAVFIVNREQMVDRITPFVYRLLLSLAVGFVGLFLLLLSIILLSRKQERQRERIMNRQLQESAANEKRANQAKSEFLSRMSHDIRTPLNGIIGMTAIAEKSLDDRTAVKSCLKKITSSSDHLLELINEVLEISRIENGKVEVKNAPVNLLELLELLADMNESRIAARSLIYRTDMEKLAHPYVIADKTLLNQILLNIIGNAVKYTEDNGSICCTVYDRMLNPWEAEYHFVVADTGIGMTPEYVEHIFDRFSQEGDGARTKYEGTGLGMAITKHLVELLGGEITVESEKDVGSTFEVILRLAICEKKEIEKEEISQKQTIIDRGYHVLLVEDNEINREIAEFLLEDAGVTCDSAEDGLQAVEAFRHSAPGTYDAVLMDILMPNMDGHEAAQVIRAMERPDAKEIPIFAMTASAYQEDRDKSFAAGMNAHLTKPLVLGDVLGALEHWCAKQKE